MSTIDPKWIQYDDTKLTIIDNNGVNELSIKEDAVLTGVSSEFVGGRRITISATTPAEETGRDMSEDLWIEVPA